MPKRKPPSSLRGGASGRCLGVALAHGIALAALLVGTAGAAAAQSGGPRADFKQQYASAEARQRADWVAVSSDNGGRPYLIVDKVNARVFVFDAGAQLQGAAPALLGMARGDRSTPGIGDRELSAIRPGDRTTPAGRFIASLDHDLHGQELLVIDYDASITLHPVVKGQPRERRAQRLESASSQDNRISFGCINVPLNFYERVVSPAFAKTNGVVYILPEKSAARDVFGSYEVPADTSRKPAQP